MQEPAKGTSSPVTESIDRHSVSTRNGKLELLAGVITRPIEARSHHVVVCLHGAFCSARDHSNLLGFFADNGVESYSLSLRGHGQSWRPGWFAYNFSTTIDDYISDIEATLEYIARLWRADRALTGGQKPSFVLLGHSFGGGQLQYLLSRSRESIDASLYDVAGLILVASAPLRGGIPEIMSNWEKVEAPAGYAYPWSPRAQTENSAQARACFFREGTDDSIIDFWLRECRTAKESPRVALTGLIWSFGDAKRILAALTGVEQSAQKQTCRKILCVSAEQDLLIKPDMVHQNALAYRNARDHDVDGGLEETVMTFEVSDSGHHIMLDSNWRLCAQACLDWLDGRPLQNMIPLHDG